MLPYKITTENYDIKLTCLVSTLVFTFLDFLDFLSRFELD